VPVRHPLGSVRILRNRSIDAPGCAGASGVPALSIGTPFPGNLGFGVSISGGAPSAPAVLLVSPNQSGGPACAAGVDLNTLIAPTLTILDATGSGSNSYPIPAWPSLTGYTLFAQWVVVDPAGGAFHGISNYALSPQRTVKIF